MRYLVPAGGTAVFLLLVIDLFFVLAHPAAAQEPDAPEEVTFLENVLEGGFYTYPALVMLAAIILVTAAGMTTARAPESWPLWPALARGLGDAAFLFAIMTTFFGLREGMQVLARIGAAVTPGDMAHGLSRALAELTLGAFVALAGLLASALLRWKRARILARMAPRAVAGEFA